MAHPKLHAETHAKAPQPITRKIVSKVEKLPDKKHRGLQIKRHKLYGTIWSYIYIYINSSELYINL